jgi:hypothetical protein
VARHIAAVEEVGCCLAKRVCNTRSKHLRVTVALVNPDLIMIVKLFLGQILKLLPATPLYHLAATLG